MKTYDPYTDDGLRKLLFDVHKAPYIERKPQPLPTLRAALETVPLDSIRQLITKYQAPPLTEGGTAVERLCQFLLEPARVSAFFAYMGQREWQLLLASRNQQGEVAAGEDEVPCLLQGGYLVYENERLCIPAEVLAILNALDLARLSARRGQMQWLKNCLDTVFALYGLAPLAVLADVYNQHPTYQTTSIAVLQQLESIPEDLRTFTVRNGQVYRTGMEPDEVQSLRRRQYGGPYYLPEPACIAYASLGIMAFMDRTVIQQTLATLAELLDIREPQLFSLAHSLLAMMSQGEDQTSIAQAVTYIQQLQGTAAQERLDILLTWLDRRVPKQCYKGYTSDTLPAEGGRQR